MEEVQNQIDNIDRVNIPLALAIVQSRLSVMTEEIRKNPCQTPEYLHHYIALNNWFRYYQSILPGLGTIQLLFEFPLFLL